MNSIESPAWWRSAVVYQIYPKSWADGNGDGIGDIAGIRARLGHLSRLGVDAIWFSPWYPSPQADGGYDVSDFRDIDPAFGDLEQVDALVRDAHDLGLKVIVDVVPNHTSDQHRFFQEALASEPGSQAWGRYHCLPGADDGASPPNDWPSVFGGSAWDPIRDAQGEPTGWWYLHLFDSAQPDLNWNHPDVHEEFRETLRFWFDRGVDGFRIDVATGLVKAPGYPNMSDYPPGHSAPSVGAHAMDRPQPQWDQPEVHDIWRDWRRLTDAYSPPRALVGEIWVGSEAAHAAYLRPDELHSSFNFHYLKCPWDGPELRRIIDASMLAESMVDAPTTWVLENHDVLRVPTRFGLEAAGATLARGPEGNTMKSPDIVPDEAVGRTRARAATLFMLGLPGSAYLYQGQELGLPEALDLPPHTRQDPAFHRTNGAEGYRDGCRVPMPWTRQGTGFGFASGEAAAPPWLPQPADWGGLSVEAQTDDPDSMLELTRAALRIRRREPALGDGPHTWLSAPADDCQVIRRPGDADDEDVLVAVNAGGADAVVPGTRVLLTSGPNLAAADGGFVLPPDTAAWLA